MVSVMRSHCRGLLGWAVRAVVLAAERERARRDDEIQPEYAEHAKQPAGCRP